MLKSQDIIIHINAVDGALSESDVKIVKSAILDDVIIHCQHYFDPKCIGQVLKSQDIIMSL